MSFLDDILFAIIGNQVINDLEHRYDQRQDPGNNAPADSGRAFVEDDDDFLGLL